MIVTTKFLFLHNPKTGGIWLRNQLRKFAPHEWKLLDHRASGLQHIGLRKVPAHHAELPTIAVVRNPWDWWVSWFFFNKKHNGPTWGPRFADCPATVDGFQKALPRLMENGSPQWNFLTAEDGRSVDHLVTYENLRLGLLEAFEAVGAPAPPRLRQAILKAPRANASKHRPYQECFDAESTELVQRCDEKVIALMGYEF